MSLLNPDRQPGQQLHAQPPQHGVPPQIIHHRDEIQVIRNHLLPKMWFALFDTVERFAKGHLPQNIKRQHIKPDRHVQAMSSLFRATRDFQSQDESVDTSLHNILLLRKCLVGEGRREKSFHLRVLDGIALATDTTAFETGAENIVEITFREDGSVWRGPVDGFAGFVGGKGELVWGYADNGAYIL